MPTHDNEWPSEHWEALISTIVDRIGVEGFLEMCTYVLQEQHGCAWVALAASRQTAEEATR